MRSLFKPTLKCNGVPDRTMFEVASSLLSLHSYFCIQPQTKNKTPAALFLLLQTHFNQSFLFASQAASAGCQRLKITISPPLSCLINNSDVQFRNFAINLLKYCWRMLIVMPVAIKPHLHNVCAKNNYELLIAQEPAENARSVEGGERRVQHWILGQKADLRSSSGAKEASQQNSIQLILCALSLSGSVLSFHVSWWVLGSYIDKRHMFPVPSHALEEEAKRSLPLRQSGTQLCASHSPQHYLVSAAASLGSHGQKASKVNCLCCWMAFCSVKLLL